VSGLAHTLGILGRVTETAKKENKVELLGGVIELQTAIIGLIEKQVQLSDENRRLSEQVRDLSDKKIEEALLRFEHDAYWRVQGDGSWDGPFSMNSWDTTKTLVRLRLDGHKRGNSYVAFWDVALKQTMRVPLDFINEHKMGHIIRQLPAHTYGD
jgi:hypothetical protein